MLVTHLHSWLGFPAPPRVTFMAAAIARGPIARCPIVATCPWTPIGIIRSALVFVRLTVIQVVVIFLGGASIAGMAASGATTSLLLLLGFIIVLTISVGLSGLQPVDEVPVGDGIAVLSRDIEIVFPRCRTGFQQQFIQVQVRDIVLVVGRRSIHAVHDSQ